MTNFLTTIPPRTLISEIAMDIGKEVVAYVEYMYPEAVKAASSTFTLSLRNTIHNEIMAALEVTGEREIRNRIADRKGMRRRHRAWWKKHRETDWEAVRAARDLQPVGDYEDTL